MAPKAGYQAVILRTVQCSWFDAPALLPLLSRGRSSGSRRLPAVDGEGPDGVAVAVEANPKAEIYPAVYVRKNNVVSEHLLPTNPLLDFETAEHRAQLTAALAPIL